jgi:hypothetical protein
MLCPITNSSADVVLDSSICLNIPSEVIAQKRLRNDSQLRAQSYTKFRINPEELIRLEMSFVPEVESVFFEAAPRRTGYHVFTVVNERDPEVRAKIYKREQAIMDEYKNLEFDFRIIARRNRDLDDITTGLGAPIFTRVSGIADQGRT